MMIVNVNENLSRLTISMEANERGRGCRRLERAFERLKKV